jgi:hypothetical protein
VSTAVFNVDVRCLLSVQLHRRALNPTHIVHSTVAHSSRKNADIPSGNPPDDDMLAAGEYIHAHSQRDWG